MIVLGIDPGSRRTGWGVVRHQGNETAHIASGVLALGGSRPLPERLLTLAEGLGWVVAEHRPEACAVERIFSAKNAHSALVLGHARGVALCEVARLGVPLFEYTSTQVKQAVAGTGGAKKSQVGRMVQMLLGHREPLAEDAADALAVALTHAAASRLALLG